MKRRSALKRLGASFMVAPFIARESRAVGAASARVQSTPAVGPIVDPTPRDLANVAVIVAVSRNTWSPGANLWGPCYDIFTGSPRIFLVESGIFHVSVLDSDFNAIDTIKGGELPQAYLNSKGLVPVAALPGTELDLEVGESILTPYGSNCGRYVETGTNDATFLEITLLPGGATFADNSAESGKAGEMLDVNLGIATANAPAPELIVAERLIVVAGQSLSLLNLPTPASLYVELGRATLSISKGSALYRNPGIFSSDPNIEINSGQQTQLSTEDTLYLPSGVEGSLEATEDVSFLWVSVSLTK